ncbi:MAG: nucleotidyltransferase domain-containing protein [Candidatus Bathyarchaeia archaeon]
MAQVKVTYPSLSRAEVVDRLRKGYANLTPRLLVSRIILFGSYAKERYTAGSDIDVIVVYRGRARDDAYKTVVNEMGLPRLEARVYTEEEFNALLAGRPRFAEMLAKEGILIAGEREWSKEAKTG